jgi:hypothetical protein
MNVPSYQMHNVLNVYSKQLKQNASSRLQTPAKRTPSGRENLKPDGKLKATIEKVSNDILKKITRIDALAETRLAMNADHGKIPPQDCAPVSEKQDTTFVFNAIDSINQKKTNTLSIDDSDFLIRKLEQLAKESGIKKSDSRL